jgi:hypothetical protein
VRLFAMMPSPFDWGRVVKGTLRGDLGLMSTRPASGLPSANLRPCEFK